MNKDFNQKSVAKGQTRSRNKAFNKLSVLRTFQRNKELLAIKEKIEYQNRELVYSPSSDSQELRNGELENDFALNAGQELNFERK